MRKAREILRLKYELGLANRQIGASLHMSHVSVGKYLQRAEEGGVKWPLAPETSDGALWELLRAAQRPPEAAGRALPDMAQVHRELHRPGVTLQLVWEEYRREHPDGYAYTQFCEYYKRFRGQLEPSLRQTYRAGEKLFVDWAGQTIRGFPRRMRCMWLPPRTREWIASSRATTKSSRRPPVCRLLSPW